MPKKVYHIKSFEGGINKKADPRDIENNELVEVTNASVSNKGRIVLSGDGKSSFVTVNADNVPVSPTDGQDGQNRFQNETPISSGHGLFSFTHDYDFNNTDSIVEPKEVSTEFICVNDGADIDIWTDYINPFGGYDNWKDSIISMGTVHNTGTDGDSEDLVDLKCVKPIYYKADNGLRVCDANFGEEELSALTAAAITSDATVTFNVDAGHGLIVGEYIQIDSEVMKVTVSNATSLTVERGRFGTKIENHDDDSKIFKINVPKTFAHIKRPMLKKAGANVNINRWVQDIQVPEAPKYDALTVFRTNILGFNGSNLISNGLYPTEPEKVHLGVSLSTIETDATLNFKTGAVVSADTTSTETVITITLAATATPDTSVDVTSATYNFAVGKFISISGATGDGAALNGVHEVVGFGDATGEVKIAADTDTVGYTQLGTEIVILEDEIIDDNLKNKYILGMSFLYDGGGSALQESNVTTALANDSANLIKPDNTFPEVSTTVPHWKTMTGTDDDMTLQLGSELITTTNNRTFAGAGDWANYGSSSTPPSVSGGRLVCVTNGDGGNEGAQLPIVQVGDGSTTSIVAGKTYRMSAKLDNTAGKTTPDINFSLGGTHVNVTASDGSPSNGTIDTTEQEYYADIVPSDNTTAVYIYQTSADNDATTTFTIDDVSIKEVASPLDTSNTNNFDFVSPGTVTNNGYRNWIFYETGTSVVEQETEYYISGAISYTGKVETGDDIRIYVGIGPSQTDVSAGTTAAIPLTISQPTNPFTGLIEFAGTATSGSSIDDSVPVAIQFRNNTGTDELATLHSINVTKKNLTTMSQTNALDLRQVKDVGKSYLSFLCNNSKTGPYFSITPNNTWSERIEGFRIYMKQVDIIGGGLADEWTMLYDVDLKEGTYVMHAKDSDEELLRLGDVPSNAWDATNSTDNKALITGNTKGDSIKVPPISTYESENGYEADTNLSARYKCVAVVKRKVFIGNLKIGDKTFPDRMLKSDIDRFDTFPDDGTHFIDVATSDGESIVALESTGDKLIQFKEKTAYAIRVTSRGEELAGTWAGAGVKHPCQIAKTPNGIFWVNAEGIYFYDGDKLNNVSSNKFRINNWLTNEDFKRPIIVGYDKFSNKIIILTTNISGAASSGYIYDINNGAITQHDNLFNWYALSNPTDTIIGNTETEL